MKNLTLENIAKAVNGTCSGAEGLLKKEITSVTTDSRKIEKDCLFVPIKGEHFDGNDFVLQAYEKGALVCFSEKKIDTDRPQIVVENVFQAIRALAEFYRQQFTIPVIGITGSVGKTSTKEMTAGVLSTRYRVRKTQGNFNNELGVPLTLFSFKEDDEVAVIEMGMSDFGEMERLSKIVRPNHCVITNIGTCHLENCGDRDGVLRAKSEIFTYWQGDGQVFLNGNDDKLITLKEVRGKTPVYCYVKPEQTAGENTEGCYAYNLINRGLRGYECRIRLKTMDIAVSIPQPGIHMVSNAVIAASVGEELGLTPEEIQEGIAAFQPVGNRGKMIETDKFLIISDCYNANPVSMKASVGVMKDASGRKVCILGDMFELGAEEKQHHYEVGRFCRESGMDLLICIGDLSAHMAEGAEGMNVVHFNTVEEAEKGIKDLLLPGDTILVKASHGMHLETVTELLESI